MIERPHRAPLLLVFSMLFSCAGPTQQILRETSQPKRPTWADRTPKIPGEYCVVANRQGKDLEEAKRGAQGTNLGKIAALIGVKIEEQSESVQNTEGKNFAEQRLRSGTVAQIQDLAEKAEYWERTTRSVGTYQSVSYDVWLLSCMPLSSVEKERQRQKQTQENELEDAIVRLRGSRKALGRGEKSKALTLLFEATALARHVPKTTAASTDGFHTAQDVLRALSAVQIELQAEALGIRVNMEGSDVDGFHSFLAKAFSTAQGVDAKTFRIRSSGEARYVINVHYTRTMKFNSEVGLRVAHINYVVKPKDVWRGAALDGIRGLALGHGQTAPAATLAAVEKAANDVHDRLSKILRESLTR